MNLSLLSQTDRFVLGPETRFEDHGAYGLFCTPAHPSFYDGNRLLLDAPLTPATARHWIGVFDAAFAGQGVRHHKLEWPGPAPDQAAWGDLVAEGYELETSLCMTLTAPPAPPPGLNPALEIRPLTLADQSALQRFMLDCHGDWSGPFLDFCVANIYARLAALEGDWWLGWLDGRVVGGMGLFFSGPLGRFQTVDTHPAARRRGVARTMVAHLVAHGFARPATRQLVMVADADYFAYQLYEQCGFRTMHQQYALFRSPRDAGT